MLEKARPARVEPRGEAQTAFKYVWLYLIKAPVLAVRYSLITVALALQTASLSTPGHFRPTTDPLLALVLVGTTTFSLVTTALAVIDVDRWSLEARRALVLVGLVVALVLLGMAVPQLFELGRATVLHSPYANDGAVMDEYAATRLLSGQNPYWRVNFPYALQHNGLDLPATVSTPLMQGQFSDARYSYPSDQAINQALSNDQHYGPNRIPAEFESHYNYPALSFLLITPLVWAGVHDLRPLYLLFIVGIALYLFRCTPWPWRYLAPLIVVADIPLLMLSTGGQPDPIYALFLLLAWGEWRSARLSGISLGLAIATKQLAWFAAPFYAVLVWRAGGWRELAKRLSITIPIFAVTNGPFLLAAPLAYVHSVAAPMTDPMFPMGSGIIALSLAGILPLLSRAAYALLELGALIAGLSAFAFGLCRRSPALGLVLATLPLLFAWRSLINYFYLTPLLALAVCLANEQLEQIGNGSTAFAADH
jgi:hypothetical protein